MSNTENEQPVRNYLTVRQFLGKYKAFTEGGTRHLIFNAEKNGFAECIRRVGKKILIVEDAFIRWLENRNGGNNG